MELLSGGSVLSELVCLLGQHKNKEGNKRSKESLWPQAAIESALCTNCIYSPGKKIYLFFTRKNIFLQLNNM